MESVTAEIQTPATNLYPFKTAGTLLTLQIIFWIVVVLMVYLNYPYLPPSPNLEWTTETISAIRIPWMTFYLFIVAGFICGNLGILLLSRGLLNQGKRFFGWIGIVASTVSLVLSFGYLYLRFSLLGFSAYVLGDLPLYHLATPIGLIFNELTLLATLFASLGLRKVGIARRTGLVVAILCAIMIPFGLYLPPFVFGLLWLALGIVLLRGTRVETKPVSGEEIESQVGEVNPALEEKTE